jgi:hypothetical protein
MSNDLFDEVDTERVARDVTEFQQLPLWKQVVFLTFGLAYIFAVRYLGPLLIVIGIVYLVRFVAV